MFIVAKRSPMSTTAELLFTNNTTFKRNGQSGHSVGPLLAEQNRRICFKFVSVRFIAGLTCPVLLSTSG